MLARYVWVASAFGVALFALGLSAAVTGCGARAEIGWGGTGAGSGTSSCPDTVPASGSACSGEGLSCSYSQPACSPSTATCTSGAWYVQSFGVGCAAECPTTAPSPGDPCQTCCLPPSCTFDIATELLCQVTGTCPNGSWVLGAQTCHPTPAPPCSLHTTPSDCEMSAACRWLASCGLPAKSWGPGCFAGADCTSDADCTGGTSCTKAEVIPCAAEGCDACTFASLCL